MWHLFAHYPSRIKSLWSNVVTECMDCFSVVRNRLQKQTDLMRDLTDAGMSLM